MVQLEAIQTETATVTQGKSMEHLDTIGAFLVAGHIIIYWTTTRSVGKSLIILYTIKSLLPEV